MLIKFCTEAVLVVATRHRQLSSRTSANARADRTPQWWAASLRIGEFSHCFRPRPKLLPPVRRVDAEVFRLGHSSGEPNLTPVERPRPFLVTSISPLQACL